MALRPGEFVQKKSGGPKMTVEGFGSENGQPTVICSWFENGTKRSHDFSPTALVPFSEPQILKATVILQSTAHEVHTVDVIEHEGQFWLVPEWYDNQAQGVTMPARIISLATLPHQRGQGSPEFVVNDPIPKYVFDGHIPPEQAHKYVVQEQPWIRFPIPPAS
jgi:uncharacterized protein YodC (DUF2158 family)